MHEKIVRTSLEGGDSHLVKTERELLMWYSKLGHRSIGSIKQLVRDGHLTNHLLSARNTPVFTDCKFGDNPVNLWKLRAPLTMMTSLLAIIFQEIS